MYHFLLLGVVAVSHTSFIDQAKIFQENNFKNSARTNTIFRGQSTLLLRGGCKCDNQSSPERISCTKQNCRVSVKPKTMKPRAFTLWQALFEPEVISQATFDQENRNGSSDIHSIPSPDAMDIVLLPLAFCPGSQSL